MIAVLIANIGTAPDSWTMDVVFLSDDGIKLTVAPRASHVRLLFRFLSLAVVLDRISQCTSYSLGKDGSWRVKSWSLAPFIVERYPLLFWFMDLCSSFVEDFTKIKIHVDVSTIECFSQQFLRALSLGFLRGQSKRGDIVLGICNASICCITAASILQLAVKPWVWKFSLWMWLSSWRCALTPRV